MPLSFSYAARSDVGMVRSENQDSGYAGPRLLAMADGMGGHAGGDIASSVAIGALADLDGEALGSAEASKALLQRITAANDEIADMVKADPSLHGMGTTLIAILRSQNKLVLAHIGDSRAFLVREGTLTQITKDHSFVQSLVDEGRITEDEAMGHPQRSLVTRVLTGQEDDEPDVTVREARIGDRYLIASDGLTDYVAGDTIAEIVTAGETPARTADRLVELALKAGAPDNVTIVVGDVVDTSRTLDTPSQPQVVGAAAARTKGTRPIPLTPAAKAAALSREATGVTDDDVTLAEEGPRSGPTRWLRRAAVALLVIIVLGGGAYAAYDWSQRQYFVGAHDGKVAIYQGVSQNLGPITLSHVRTSSDVVVDDLPDFYRAKVEDTISKDSLSAAQALVDQLRSEAAQCAASKASGTTCSGTATTPQPTTTTTPTTSTPTTSVPTTSAPTSP
jgi:serine/threonine protein phosphatase PrpC